MFQFGAYRAHLHLSKIGFDLTRPDAGGVSGKTIRRKSGNRFKLYPCPEQFGILRQRQAKVPPVYYQRRFLKKPWKPHDEWPREW